MSHHRGDLDRRGEKPHEEFLQGESKEKRKDALGHGTVNLNICQRIHVCTLYSVFYQEYDNCKIRFFIQKD